jgi:DNA-binding CsgD family transcriptional regulator
MKALSLKDLPRSAAIKLFELGYAAGSCRKPEEFQKILQTVLNVIPADAVVCGYGTPANDVDMGQLWNSAKLANITIAHVESQGWPQDFLQDYMQENILSRDGQSYECMRTQKPQLWIDVYKRDRHSFDPWTKRGFDPKFVDITFDHHLSLILRKTHMDNRRFISDFSLRFGSRKTAHQFRALWDGIVPFLHNALLSAHQAPNGTGRGKAPILSSRQQEVLKWLMEGKSNWEIGRILGIAERTVKFHIQILLQKFAAANRSQLVANAFQQFHGHL